MVSAGNPALGIANSAFRVRSTLARRRSIHGYAATHTDGLCHMWDNEETWRGTSLSSTAFSPRQAQDQRGERSRAPSARSAFAEDQSAGCHEVVDGDFIVAQFGQHFQVVLTLKTGKSR